MRFPSIVAHFATEISLGHSLNLTASPFLIITDVRQEPNGNIYVKVVQEVLSEGAHLQAGGLPVTAGPSSVSKTLAGCKRKGLDKEKQTAAQLPATKRARGQNRDSVPAPAAHPGPALALSSKQGGKKVLRYRPGEVQHIEFA